MSLASQPPDELGQIVLAYIALALVVLVLAFKGFFDG